MNHLAGDLISDGGQWDMVVNLLEVHNRDLSLLSVEAHVVLHQIDLWCRSTSSLPRITALVTLRTSYRAPQDQAPRARANPTLPLVLAAQPVSVKRRNPRGATR